MKKHIIKGKLITAVDFSIELFCDDDEEAEAMAIVMVENEDPNCLLLDTVFDCEIEEHKTEYVTKNTACYEQFEPNPYDYETDNNY